MTKRFLISALIGFILITPSLSWGQSAQRNSDLTALVRQLQEQVRLMQEQIASLQTQLKVAQEEVAEVKAELKITRSLRRGVVGDEVKQLQEFLKRFPDIYPEGLVTGYFGPRTEAAVKKLQEKHGIEVIGIVGPKTLAKINELITEGVGASGVIPPGLLTAPGIQKKLDTATTTPPSGATTTLPAATSTPATSPGQTTTTSTIQTTTTIIFQPPTSSSGGLGAGSSTTSGSGSATTTTTTATSTATSTTSTTPPPVFTITSPNGGEQWTAGNTYSITWTSAGTAVSTVNIELYKSGSYNTSVAYNISNNGGVNWTIPSTITTGSDYKIRAHNNMYYSNFDESNDNFSITVPVTAPSAPPIGYWKFDGNGNNEIAGSPSAVAVGNTTLKASGGKFGGYLYIPTNSDWAKIPYNSMFDLPGPFTIEFWFRQRADQSFLQDLVYKGNGINNYNFRIFRQLWNQYNFGPVIMGSTAVNTGYWSSPTNSNQLPHGSWHHVVYTRNASEAVSFLDGAILYTLSFTQNPEYSGPVKTPAVDIIIGDSAVDTDIDNLRMYNYALSRSEVLYNWQDVPGTATTIVDTTPPTISNIQASSTATGATIAWTTNEAADSQVEYDITTTYGSATTLDAALITNHSVNIAGLSAATTYHYRVKSKDAAGNLATSVDQALTTTLPSASIPTPLSMRWNWFGRITLPTTIQNYQLAIYYPPNAIDAPASFNIYLKKPGESDFTKTNYPKSSLTKYVASSGGEASYSAYPLGSYGVPSGDIPLGEYKVYATAVDNAGIETAPTLTATGNYHLAPLIVNPANGSTKSSLTQIDLSNPSSLANPRYTASLFGANGYIWAPNAFYGNSVTYSGPALSSANNPHTLVVSIFPSSIDPADSSPYTVNTFNIATTTASTVTKSNLATLLSSLATIIQELQRLLSRY